MQNSRFIKRTFIAAVATALINSYYTFPAYAEDFIKEDTSTNPNTDLTLLDVSSDTEYDSISIVHHPKIIQNQFTVRVNNSSLTVKGSTSIKLHATDYATGSDQGNYALYVNAGTIELNGDVDISVFQRNDDHDLSNIGANAIYAKGNGQISVGTTDSSVRISSIAQKPDAISAKEGGQVYLKSSNNQVIGSIDFISLGMGTMGSKVKGVFSGPNSFWFGDDQSVMNASLTMGPIEYKGKDDIQSLYDMLSRYFPDITEELQLKGTEITDELNLTFEDGAQWTYFGLSESEIRGGAELQTIPKRISSITLNKDGIINLYDEDIQNTWKELGLLDVYPELKDVEHDYVFIGDLKGDKGIFRLDLSAEDRSQSDMIFVEGSSNESMGTFYIEPYNMDKLESVSPDNTLAFALVAHSSNIQFADKINLEGETLFDYELEIDHRNLTEDDESKDSNDPTKSEFHGQIKDFKDILLDNYEPDTVWFIKRINMKESSAALAMTGIGYAAYDAAVEMDRKDLREALSQHSDGNTGLWIRLLGGSTGIEGQYDWDRTGVVVGADHQVGSHTLGAWFSYEKGDADLLDVTGQGDLSRYEFALYDTIHFGSQYLDLVGRIGRVSAEFDASSPAYRTTGSFDQDYGALSAEYVWTLLHQPSGFFVEPQAQIQAA